MLNDDKQNHIARICGLLGSKVTILGARLCFGGRVPNQSPKTPILLAGAPHSRAGLLSFDRWSELDLFFLLLDDNDAHDKADDDDDDDDAGDEADDDDHHVNDDDVADDDNDDDDDSSSSSSSS